MIAALIVLLTVLSYAIAWVLAVPILVPFLNTAVSFPFMIDALRQGRIRVAIARMLVWAAALGVCAMLLSYARPQETGELFLHGAAYRVEMFTWVMTGQGAESRPSQFIPLHARDTAIFAGLAIGTAGALAMPMGAALMNYMGHYVGTLALHSARPALTMVLGWHPWSVIRIVSFVAIGTIPALPLLARLLSFPVDWREPRRLLLWAGGGLIADVILKSLLAPFWQRLLLHTVGW